MKKIVSIVLLAGVLAGCSLLQKEPSATRVKLTQPEITIITPTPQVTNQITPIPMSKDITAIIHTSKGDMKLKLFTEKAPNTVDNFIGLATGSKEWLDPKTGKKVTGKPLYQNLIFHRVIEGFMIQGGDPLGTGYGGPGYKFADEPVTDSYIRGTLAMANSGKNTNGSQFFIVHRDSPLPKDYTIFGRIDASDSASFATLDNIASVKTDGADKPLDDVLINSIEIIEE